MAELDPKEKHWTEVDSVTAGLPGVRSFRLMTDEEIEKYNKSKTGNTKVQPSDVKLPEALT